MKPAVKVEKQVLEVYNKWLYSYLNGDVKTNTSIFNVDTCFTGTSVNEAFLICSTTSNFFTTIIELGSTINLRIND
ncbi:hypothetical protein [Maribacter thermophilus]|uniref:hypothetical protein n=1 Tax=Maribacter thermophilus TaxID=1197874 RepID=UPI00064156BF|nr:hypothetical protein [Maribacter thermophilus]